MAKYRITPSSKAIIQLPISIGHKAEKGVEAIEFDVTAWVETYGSGTLTVIMRRWGDAIPYPIALEIDENNKATWTLSDTDTAKAGMAYAQLSYIVGETVVKKSDIYTFRVMDSLTGEGEPPEAYGSWLEQLTHLAAEAMAEVLDIEGIVTDKTLTVDGGIADAKATGDALSALEDQFGEETDKLKADLGALTKPQRLADGTDLDTVLTPGVYTLYATSSYLNKPTQDGEHGILEVWKENYEDTGRVFQRLTYTYKGGRTNSEIWVRSKSGLAGATWVPWVSVSNMSINDVGNLLQSQTGIISKVEGSYINLTTDPVSLTPVVNAVWAHSVVSCAGGDTFIINADGGQMPRAWGFLDSSNHVLSVADESTIVNGLKLTAPTNAVKLIINDRSGATSYIVGNNLASNKIDVQQNPVDFGKALIVGRNGKVMPGDISVGITDAVKAALLNCFKQIYWDSDNSYNAYLALEAALYSTESRLTALISYGESYLFEDDPLGKVKWMMLVRYDGTEVSPGDYTLSGTLTEGKNVLTVLYNDERTAITVDAEAVPKTRLVLTEEDIVKFNGVVETVATNELLPPYLSSNNAYRSYYATKGHYPYKNDSDELVIGKYPIPIPAYATHVRVAVVPHEYEIKIACWRYNNSTGNYSLISGSNTDFAAWHADADIIQYENNARALSVIIKKPDGSAFDTSTEPTEVLVQFT